MRRTSNQGRRDSNHSEIVAALRKCGMTVQDLGAVGDGCPDLLVGWRGRNYLVEIKDGEKAPSARALTVAQQEWHATWGGAVIVADSIEGAIGQIARGEAAA